MSETSDQGIPDNWQTMSLEDQIRFYAEIGSWMNIQYYLNSTELDIPFEELRDLLAKAYEIGAAKLSSFQQQDNLPEFRNIPEFQERWQERASKAREAVSREDLVNLINLWNS